jgi:hypothetical protein
MRHVSARLLRPCPARSVNETASYTQTVRWWITIATLSILAVVLLGLAHERGVRGSPECGGGFACPSVWALDAAASDDSREFGAPAREDRTDFDPYDVARA